MQHQATASAGQVLSLPAYPLKATATAQIAQGSDAPFQEEPAGAGQMGFTVNSIFNRLKAGSGLVSRPTQITLAQEIKEGILTKSVTCIEAPTGTGKTLGYLAGAIEAQHRLQYAPENGKSQLIPIVIATATVGLQDQIIRYDIPRLVKIGVLDPRKVAIAKGRNRYFCPRTAQALEEKSAADSQMDMLDATKGLVAEAGQVIALDMLKKWRTQQWDGDKDSWGGKAPNCWEANCAANVDTCVMKSCEHYAACPYMQSRAKIAQATLVIANHDLVISDLMRRNEDAATGVLPFKEYALIVDEAHHFPEKALATRKAEITLSQLDWLEELPEYALAILKIPRIAQIIDKSLETSSASLQEDALVLKKRLQALGARLTPSIKTSEDSVISWGCADVPVYLQEEVESLSPQAHTLAQTLKLVAKVLSEHAQSATGSEKGLSILRLAQTHKYQNLAKKLSAGMFNFSSRDVLVRWAMQSNTGATLYAQPMEGKEVLETILWGRGVSISMVSATLQISGSFDRFAEKSGLPSGAKTLALPPVFDYSQGYLHTPLMQTSPADKDHPRELVYKLERLFEANPVKGVLVLFNSRKSMELTARTVNSSLQGELLVQGAAPIAELVAKHKERILAGYRSILFGLDSMAEGLDLPDVFCEQVVITRLPFGAAADPVELARKDALGPLWFSHSYLSDMITKFIQCCGRLIRRETDQGVITVLDNRLTTKRYRHTVLAALPAFSRCNTIRTYLDKKAEKALISSHEITPVTVIDTLATTTELLEHAPAEMAKIDGAQQRGEATQESNLPALNTNEVTGVVGETAVKDRGTLRFKPVLVPTHPHTGSCPPQAAEKPTSPPRAEQHLEFLCG